MIIEPSAVVLYADNLRISRQFYQDLLGINPVDASLTFSSFILSNGMGLGLKARHAVEPPLDGQSSGELAFTVDNHKKVDALFAEWQNKGLKIAQHPTVVSYGYTFVALDPDNNQLRVVALFCPDKPWQNSFLNIPCIT